MNPVVHFEMPYDDRARMAAFYRSAFGWKFELLGPEMGDYAIATTHEPTVACEPASDGPPPTWINGGFFQRKPDWPGQQPLVVIAVGSMPAAMQRVATVGGTVLGEPMDIPGVGKYVAFTDTEGNHVCMLEPIMPAPAKGTAS